MKLGQATLKGQFGEFFTFVFLYIHIHSSSIWAPCFEAKMMSMISSCSRGCSKRHESAACEFKFSVQKCRFKSGSSSYN
jgi:hypothetical protein